MVMPLTSAVDEVCDLLREGRAAARFPALARALSTLDGEELARAGRLLSRLDPDDVLGAHPATPVVSAAITGHGTLTTLVPSLTAELARHGVLLRPSLRDFDSYVRELTDPAGELYAMRPDLVLCVLDPHIVFDEVAVPWTPADVSRTFGEKLTLLDRLATTFESAGGGTLVLNTVPLPRQYAAQLLDYGSRAELGAGWREANARLLRLAADHQSLVIVDLDTLVADGVAVTDPRLSTYAKAHLSPALLAAYARQAGHLVRQLLGLGKKCLAVDLDNTMWGGVLLEDGPDGIEVSGTLRGEAFQAFQRVVKQIGSQGVPVAAFSKNDPDPVREVLRTHPGMTMREDDYLRIVAGWGPKHESIKGFVADLNLGADSVVFVDDNAHECGLVREELPGAAVIQLGTDPALHAQALLAEGWFDTRQLTASDYGRIARYRNDLARKDFLATFDSTEDYLRALEIDVQLLGAQPADVPRIAQLTLRTNQFNTTTRRLQPADVSRLIAAPGSAVLGIHAADKFAGAELVGAIFLSSTPAELTIDNFVLSCRVFARGIEQACLAAIVDHARDRGLAAVNGSYRRTKKNAGVRDLYPRHGFELVEEADAVSTFRRKVDPPIERPAHITFHERFPGGAQ